MQPDSPTPTPRVQPPNYTQVPNVILDEMMAELSGAEFKVLMYIVRHTFGYHKPVDDISLSQITKGIVKRDGTRLDAGTGVSKSTAVAALRELVVREIVYRTHNADERGDRATTYHLNVAAPTRVQKTDTGGSEIEPVRVQESNTQNKRRQEETEGQEGFRIEGSTELGVAYDVEGIEQMVMDFRREFRDKAELGPTRQRTINLFMRSGASVERFVEAMYAARKATKASAVHKESPMAYWFAVLEDRLNGGQE